MLFGSAGWFLLGAALGYAGFVWKGALGRWPLFAGGFGALLLGLASGKLPILLLFFGASTAVFVFEAARGRISATIAGGFAISDLLLAGGVTLYQLNTTQWDFPQPGEWGAATPLVAVAAAFRFAGFVSDDALDAAGAATAGWWQGMALAWWAGPSAVLVGAGLALPILAFIARIARGTPAIFLLAGGLGCVLAGSGSQVLALAALGAAATAFALGERMIPTWILAGLPLSLVSAPSVPLGFPLSFPPGFEEVSLLAGVAAGAAVVAIVAATLVLCLPGGWGGRVTSTAALAAAVAATGLNIRWWGYGLIVAGTLTLLTTRAEDVPLAVLPVERLATPPALPKGRYEVLVFASWVVLGITVVFAMRLLLLGGRTGFL